MGGNLLLLLCFLLASMSRSQHYQKENQQLLDRGKERLDEYQKESLTNECWRVVFTSLNESCRDLEKDAQMRLAVAFANCHWSSAGRRTYDCATHMSIANCTRDMSDSSFDVYTQFYNHIEDACYYLQSQLWQENTEKLIDDLAFTSEDALAKITQSLSKHEILERGQERSLSNQRQLLQDGVQLQEQLHSASDEVADAFSHIQQQAWSYHQQFTTLFESLSSAVDRVQQILSSLLGEFIGIERVIVFILGVLLSFLFTMSTHTASARPVLLAVVVAETVFVERWVVNMFLTSGTTDSTQLLEQLHSMLWNIRYATVVVCIGVLVYYSVTYRNYVVANHQLLTKIVMQNRQIKRHLNLDTEELPDDVATNASWFVSIWGGPAVSTDPDPLPVMEPVQSADLPAPTLLRYDSIGHDQPDSAREELTAGNRIYSLRKRSLHTQKWNRLLDQESATQFANLVFHSEQLTRQSLHKRVRPARAS